MKAHSYTKNAKCDGKRWQVWILTNDACDNDEHQRDQEMVQHGAASNTQTQPLFRSCCFVNSYRTTVPALENRLKPHQCQLQLAAPTNRLPFVIAFKVSCIDTNLHNIHNNGPQSECGTSISSNVAWTQIDRRSSQEKFFEQTRTALVPIYSRDLWLASKVSIVPHNSSNISSSGFSPSEWFSFTEFTYGFYVCEITRNFTVVRNTYIRKSTISSALVVGRHWGNSRPKSQQSSEIASQEDIFQPTDKEVFFWSSKWEH